MHTAAVLDLIILVFAWIEAISSTRNTVPHRLEAYGSGAIPTRQRTHITTPPIITSRHRSETSQ